jgi:hypothetical protein
MFHLLLRALVFMIDYPIIERAREVVALHAKIGAEATR